MRSLIEDSGYPPSIAISAINACDRLPACRAGSQQGHALEPVAVDRVRPDRLTFTSTWPVRRRHHTGAVWTSSRCRCVRPVAGRACLHRATRQRTVAGARALPRGAAGGPGQGDRAPSSAACRRPKSAHTGTYGAGAARVDAARSTKRTRGLDGRLYRQSGSASVVSHCWLKP